MGGGIGVTDLPTLLALLWATLSVSEFVGGEVGLPPLLKTPRELESITAGELPDLIISAVWLRFSTTSPPEITTGFKRSRKYSSISMLPLLPGLLPLRLLLVEGVWTIPLAPVLPLLPLEALPKDPYPSYPVPAIGPRLTNLVASGFSSDFVRPLEKNPGFEFEGVGNLAGVLGTDGLRFLNI